MGVDIPPSPEALLRTLAIVLVVAGGGYSVLVVSVATMLNPRNLWIAWAIGILSLVSLSTLYFLTSFPDQRPSLGVILYMNAALLSIPSGLATWTAVRLQRVPVRQSTIRRVLKTFLVFLVSLPLGFIVAAVPDIAALF
jgi:uncharacterized membrane protein YkgB